MPASRRVGTATDHDLMTCFRSLDGAREVRFRSPDSDRRPIRVQGSSRTRRGCRSVCKEADCRRIGGRLCFRAMKISRNGGRSASRQIFGERTAADRPPGAEPQSERRPHGVRAGPWTARGAHLESVQILGQPAAPDRRPCRCFRQRSAADRSPCTRPRSERRPRRARADPWTARGVRPESVQLRGRQNGGRSVSRQICTEPAAPG